MDNKISKKTILILIFMIIGVIIVGTFAWLSFRSKDTAMVLTIGQIDNVRITLSPYQIKSNMGSVLQYSSGTVTNIEAINNSSSSKKFKLYYKINTIDSNLAISSFKYTITRSSTKNGTYTTYGTEGNFNGATSNSEKVILEETLASNETYYYKVYIWLDGNGNVSSAQGKTFNAELRADILAHTVTFDANGGTVNISSKEVTTGLQYGELPTPTRKGYKFLGWNGKNLYNPDKMTFSNSTHTQGTEEISLNSGVYDRILNKQKWVPKENTTYTIVVQILENTLSNYIMLYTDSRFYIENYNNSTSYSIPAGNSAVHVVKFTTRNDFTDVTLGSFWFQSSKTVTGTFRTKLAVYEGEELTTYEPYYIKSDTTVVQDEDHTLTAIWEEANPVVTLNANGGTIPATSGWTGSGSTATKQVEYNGTYGNLPMPTRSGYTFLGWNGKNKFDINAKYSAIVNNGGSDNNTKRIFTPHTYCYGLSTNNYQWTTKVSNIIIDDKNLSFNSSLGYGVVFPFVFDSGLQYTLFSTATLEEGCNNTVRRAVMYYEEDGTYISNILFNGIANQKITFSIPNNTYFTVVYFGQTGENTCNVSFSNIQLEEGTSATPYEPYYISSNTTVVQENNHTLTAMWKAN